MAIEKRFPVPEGWTSESCPTCMKYLTMFKREEMYLYGNPFRRQVCCMPLYAATAKKEDVS